MLGVSKNLGQCPFRCLAGVQKFGLGAHSGAWPEPSQAEARPTPLTRLWSSWAGCGLPSLKPRLVWFRVSSTLRKTGLGSGLLSPAQPSSMVESPNNQLGVLVVYEVLFFFFTKMPSNSHKTTSLEVFRFFFIWGCTLF